MKVYFISILQLFSCFLLAEEWPIKYENNRTYSYDELIEEYRQLGLKSEIAELKKVGNSDSGKPIHLFIIDKSRSFNPEEVQEQNKQVILINNGIHAGEACGIDASVEIAKRLLNPSSELYPYLDSVIVLIVPVYNVGGMLNRNSYSRANQNGPQEYGFRGNAKNLDLNRDFIKCDSRNAQTFSQLFNAWNPDFFIDTHTTNGSDHQYTLTLIASQKDKLNPVLSSYQEEKMLPAFYKSMEEKRKAMIPYVYALNRVPEEGIKAFLETPRYSSGYTSLFNCFSFITEAHVFKPFKDRVEHTIGFLETLISYAAANNTALSSLKKRANEESAVQKNFPLSWELDSSQFELILFNGFSSVKRKSKVTNLEMSFYDTTLPYSKQIRYYKTYKANTIREKPKYYVLPQAYQRVINRLDWNEVHYSQLKTDSTIKVSKYEIESFETLNQPYEGHYLHYDIEVRKKTIEKKFYTGDYIIPVNQQRNRFIIETMEPESVDSYFAWNFFDAVLQQKEWFSDYAFEPKAKKILDSDEKLRLLFEEKKKDTAFAKSNFSQLYFIYKNSPYFEKTFNEYPVYRIE